MPATIHNSIVASGVLQFPIDIFGELSFLALPLLPQAIECSQRLRGLLLLGQTPVDEGGEDAQEFAEGEFLCPRAGADEEGPDGGGGGEDRG